MKNLVRMAAMLCMLACTGLAATPLATPVLAAHRSHAMPFGLDQLMAMLAQVPASTLPFTEQKQVAMLNQPLQMSGVLSYSRPNFVAKHVTSPYEELIQVNGAQLIYDKPSQHQHHVTSIQNDPSLWALIESIRGTLSGNLESLRQYYSMELAGTAGDWSLTLTPADHRMQRYMRSVRFTGAGSRIKVIDIIDRNGYNDIMTLARTPA